MRKRALIAMSGGVDSSVAAYLMKKAGYDCIGITMKLYDNDDIGMQCEKSCCSLSDIEDARAVARKIDIPYYVVNFKDDFKDKVINNFTDSYLNGMTPNPCIECNKHLKFKHLYQKAKELECDVIVTGHYGKIIKDEKGYHLLKGVDAKKDQSYVLYPMKKESLESIVLPLGDYTKEEIRKIAEEEGFYNANKKDSQDICFIVDGDYKKFIENTTGIKGESGDFISVDNKVLGKHKGYFYYTIGQRKGLGISGQYPYYVVDIDPVNNRVILGTNEDLLKTTLIADEFNWIDDIENGKNLKGRIRYHQVESNCSAEILEDGRVKVVFETPQRAITKGQAVVLYREDYVVGGGRIVEVVD